MARAIAWLAVWAGCSHSPAAAPAAQPPTCLVLSVGAADGVALLGAVAAARQKAVPISCVVGTGVGALVGALYASAPAEDTRARFEALVGQWAAAVEPEAGTEGLGAALLFGPAAMGGPPVAEVSPALEPGSAYRRRLEATDRRDWDRLVGVLDRFFGGRRIEGLMLPYVAISIRPQGPARVLVPVRTGGLAQAVAASVANPLLFPERDEERPAVNFDPANDPANVTPIHQACRVFPGARLLAINVSGQRSFYRTTMSCSLQEVTVAPTGLSAAQVLELGAPYRAAVARGFSATSTALGLSAGPRP